MRYTPFTLALVLLTGCSSQAAITSQPVQTAAKTEQTTVTEDKDDGSVHIDLSEGENDMFICSDGWTNGSMFNVSWRKENITFKDGKMQLSIDKDKKELIDNIPYSGAEYRSNERYGYGRYETSMKAIKNSGVVSSFFTYTGPSDNEPWDEIDIEILGKDTTKVQFNYFTDGTGNHEYLYDLGFDASEGLHDYAFEWYEDKIVWFVDGKEVYTATENIPSTPGRIMMNTWCSKGVDGWTGKFDDSALPVTAEYGYINFTPFN